MAPKNVNFPHICILVGSSEVKVKLVTGATYETFFPSKKGNHNIFLLFEIPAFVNIIEKRVTGATYETFFHPKKGNVPPCVFCCLELI